MTLGKNYCLEALLVAFFVIGFAGISKGESSGISSASSISTTVSLINSTIKIPKTGATTCYDSSGNVISCVKTGQDGELQKGVVWPHPRFAINADTTITDKLTGLVWAPNGNLITARDPLWDNQGPDFYGAVTWQHALNYIAKLNAESYLGHNDWRLPNCQELRSLIIYDQPSIAAWLNSLGFTNARAGDFYWSSTSYINDTAKAWVVDMDFGNTNYFNKANKHYLWPVRAGQ